MPNLTLLLMKHSNYLQYRTKIEFNDMKTYKFIFCIALATFAIASCNNDDVISPENGSYNEPPLPTESHPAKAIELTNTQQNISKSLQTFSWDIFEVISNQQKNSGENQNVIFSPLSLEVDLAMLLNGLQGETLQELLEIMHLSGYTINEINQYFNNLSEGIIEADNATKFSSSNSLWYNKRYQLIPDFEQTLKEYYNCEFFPVVYGDETTKKINKWAEERTYGRINHIIDYTSSDDIYHLINAVYFRSRWRNGKSKCGAKTFTNANGTTKQVEMFKGETYGHITTSEFSSTIMPFSNSAFGMFFILPNEGISFSEVYQAIKSSGETFSKMPNSQEVIVTLPIFEAENEIYLTSVLRNIDGEELLSKVNGVEIFKNLSLSIPPVIKQIANISVDEEGAEAAAVTIFGDVSAGPPEQTQPLYLTFDRPFIFGIVERSTGMPLFIGEIVKM